MNNKSKNEIFLEESQNLDINLSKIEDIKIDLNDKLKFYKKESDSYKNEYKDYKLFQEYQELYNKTANDLDLIEQKMSSPYFGHMYLNEKEQDEDIFIGEQSIKNEKGENIVYDWRSPVCSLFYEKQTSMNYNGYKYDAMYKRQLDIINKKLVNCVEVYSSNDATQVVDLFLKEVLKQKKNISGFTDIIRTIEDKQNKIIRNDINKNIVCQGVAGTGKTVIITHRLSYLLYNNPNLNPQNFLFIAPNNIFKNELNALCIKLQIDKIKIMTLYEYYIDKFNYYFNLVEKENYKIKHIIDDINVDIDKVYSKEYLDEKYKVIENYIMDKIGIIAQKYNYKFDDNDSCIEKGRNLLRHIRSNLLSHTISNRTDYNYVYDTIKPRNIILNCFEKICVGDYKLNTVFSNKNYYRVDIFTILYILDKLGYVKEGTYKYLYIDEAQDYNDTEIILLKNIENNSIINIFGDYNQNISKNSIKRNNWNNLMNSGNNFDYYELNENYRNTTNVVDYCNKTLNLKMLPIGIPKDDVIVNNFIDINEIIKKAIETNSVIITKNDLYIDEISKVKDVKVYNVIEAKGLEFPRVIVIDDGLSRNEKYIAFTRSLGTLEIYTN